MTYGALFSTKLVSQGNYTEAVAKATEEIRLNPGEPEAYFNRGQAHAGLQRYDEAVADYERALGMDGSASGLDVTVVDDELFDALRCKAVALKGEGEAARALATLERYRGILPGGRHVDDLEKWVDHINGVEVVWHRDRV